MNTAYDIGIYIMQYNNTQYVILSIHVVTAEIATGECLHADLGSLADFPVFKTFHELDMTFIIPLDWVVTNIMSAWWSWCHTVL